MQLHPLTLSRDIISRPVALTIWWSLSVRIIHPFGLCSKMLFQMMWIIELLPFASKSIVIYVLWNCMNFTKWSQVSLFVFLSHKSSSCFCLFWVRAVLIFEFTASHLLGRWCSTIWSTSPALFCFSYFQVGSHGFLFRQNWAMIILLKIPW
jgi:hypothetical protein